MGDLEAALERLVDWSSRPVALGQRISRVNDP